MRCHIGDIPFGSALFAYKGIELGAKVWLVKDVRKLIDIAHLRMLLYDNDVDPDLTALLRSLIGINAV